MVLLKAYYLTVDFSRDGIPVWWDESDDVDFEIKRKTSRSHGAVERAEKQDTSGKQERPPGRYYVPVPKTRGGKPFPTLADYLQQLVVMEGRKKPDRMR